MKFEATSKVASGVEPHACPKSDILGYRNKSRKCNGKSHFIGEK